MKKPGIIAAGILLFAILSNSCSKTNNPSTPNVAATVNAALTAAAGTNATQTEIIKLYSPTSTPTISATPNIAQTEAAVLTMIAQQQTAISAGYTATGTPNVALTQAAVLTIIAQQQTAAAAGYTATSTFTNTLTPNATQTAASILTMIAQQQTAAAVGYTATCTVTITPTITATPTNINTPDQTQTAAAIATIVAQQQTAAAALWTATTTITATPTVTPTFTATPTATIDYSVLVSVPGGTYVQEDTSGNSFAHTISAFNIGKYLLTYNLWYTVRIWATSYAFQNYGMEEAGSGTPGAAPVTVNQPVTKINWRDAIVWCNAYSQYKGLTPVYYYDSAFAQPITSSVSGSYSTTTCTAAGCFDNPYVNWAANGYRLPTEGEYQYAASYTGTPPNYASGATDVYSDTTATALVAWFLFNASGGTQPVGTKAPNALGIYDMSGNLYEWCWDWYAAYPAAGEIDYKGATSGSNRIMRGGNYHYDASNLQVGFRWDDFPADSSIVGNGIRVVTRQ